MLTREGRPVLVASYCTGRQHGVTFLIMATSNAMPGPRTAYGSHSAATDATVRN